MAKRELAAANHDSRIDGRARLEWNSNSPICSARCSATIDRHLVMIEDRLGVNIAARGNRVMIEGDPDAAHALATCWSASTTGWTRARTSMPQRSKR